MKTFTEQLQSVLEGTFPHGASLTVSATTPLAMLNVGCKDLPIMMGQTHAAKCNRKFDDLHHDHGISAEVMAQIPEKMMNPVFMFDSDKRKDTVVLVLDLFDDMNQPIMVCIHLNGFDEQNGVEKPVNFITSVYGKRQDGTCAQFSRALSQGRLLYYNAELCDEMFTRIGFTIDLEVVALTMDANTYQQSQNAVNTVTNRSYFNSFYGAGKHASYATRYN